MPTKTNGEKRTYMRVPVSFNEEIKKEAKAVGLSVAEYLVGKKVVNKLGNEDRV